MFEVYTQLVYRTITQRFGKQAIAFTGVALAIASLVVLEAIMEGVGDAMIENSVSIHHGHVAAAWEGDRALLNDIKQKLPQATVLERKIFGGTLSHNERQISLMLYGIHPKAEREQTAIAAKLKEGEYLTCPGGIILGTQLADRLQAKLGDNLILSAPDAQRTYRVDGIYRTGIELFDARTAFVQLADAPGRSNELAVFLPPGSDNRAAADELARTLPADAKVTPWQESMAELTQLVDLNHVSMNIVLFLALAILAFGVSNTVFISISERTRELGILKAMGFTPRHIQVLVVLEVIILVSIAGMLGTGIGFAAAEVLRVNGLDLTQWTSENPHFISSGIVHPRLTGRSISLPLLVAFACGLIAAVLPARRAGQTSVAEALRTI